MPGLEGVNRYPGHLEAQISLHLIFFLWGYIKNIVYAERIRNIQHLQERITSAIDSLTRDMIQKSGRILDVWTSPELLTVHLLKFTKVSLKF